MTYPPPPAPDGPDNNPYGQQLPPPPPPAYGQPYGQTPAQGGNNGLAIAGMVVGIVSICAALIACLGIILGAAGAIMSHVAMNQIKQTGQSNRGMALAGIICGWAGCALGILNAILGVVLRSNGLF